MTNILTSQRHFFSAGLLTFAFFALLFTAPTHADNSKATGHAIHFAVTESARIDNDLVAVSFRYLTQAPTADLVMQAINQKMQAANNVLKDIKHIEVQTGQYNVNPVYDKKRVITHWQGQQSLTIRTANQAGLPTLLEKVQPFLTYQSMRFSVSDAKQKQAKAQLLDKALKQYQLKAQHIADSFGAKHYQLTETRIDLPNHSQPYAESYMRTTRVMSDMAAPVIQAGKTELNVQITGTIWIPH